MEECMEKGCSVFILTDANPHKIPARTLYGALNLHTAAQTANVAFYDSPSPGTQHVAQANTLAAQGQQQCIMGMPAKGINMESGCLTVQADGPILGAGVAVFYDAS